MRATKLRLFLISSYTVSCVTFTFPEYTIHHFHYDFALKPEIQGKDRDHSKNWEIIVDDKGDGTVKRPKREKVVHV